MILYEEDSECIILQSYDNGGLVLQSRDKVTIKC